MISTLPFVQVRDKLLRGLLFLTYSCHLRAARRRGRREKRAAGNTLYVTTALEAGFISTFIKANETSKAIHWNHATEPWQQSFPLQDVSETPSVEKGKLWIIVCKGVQFKTMKILS